MSAAVTFPHTYTTTSGSDGLNPHARNPEVLSRLSQIPLLLQMHNRGESHRTRVLAEGILQRASMYVMNQAYTTPIPAPRTGIQLFWAYQQQFDCTQAADLLKHKAKEVRNGQ